MTPEALAVLGALAAARTELSEAELLGLLTRAGVGPEGNQALGALRASGQVVARARGLGLSPSGVDAFLTASAAIDRAFDPSPSVPGLDGCPSLPWITSVRTEWIEAVSINYAVAPEALAPLLPEPLEPELHKGQAWVQVLMSSLKDMRPQGLLPLFGVCFYQVSYRAAVLCRRPDGSLRRGGYFLRSETNDPVMRSIGNRLAEFRFHDFGGATMVVLRDGERLTLGVDPDAEHAGGRLFGTLDTRPLQGPPPGSLWTSLDDLHEPLVECYDALGVDRAAGWLYVLTIDREPWNARFVTPLELYLEWFDRGPLGGGAARLDSVLHLERCAYSWRPLRRERLVG